MYRCTFISFTCLTLLIAGVAWLNDKGRDTMCNRIWPAPRGRWKNEPPFWEMENCPVQMFSKENVTNCMSGRTFYVIGNSVARQSAFNMVELLGGMGVDRENQKAMCPKHETTWDSSCQQEYGGVKIKYLFLQYYDGFFYDDRGGFPFYRYREFDPIQNKYVVRTGRHPNATATFGVSADEAPELHGKLWLDDNCWRKQTRGCFRDFFKGATEKDVLVFQLGFTYPQPSEEEETALKEKVLETGELGVDMHGWLLSSATAFRAHIAATFPGTVFCASIAQMNPHKYLSYLNPKLYRVNEIQYALWQTSNEEKPWYFIDQWAINDGRFQLYNDHIHFNGMLSHAFLYQMLNELCPGGGDSKLANPWTAPQFANTLLYCTDNREFFFVNSEGYRMIVQKGPDHLLPAYMSSYPVLQKSLDEIKQVANSNIICRFLPDQTLLLGDGRTVFLVDGRYRRAFPNAQVFMAHGFSFEQVQHIESACINVIPLGPDMS